VKISSLKTFKITNFKYYLGPNPYLNTGALVFDFTLLRDDQPLAIQVYQQQISQYFPPLENIQPSSYGDLFIQTLGYFSQLNMDLHLKEVSRHNYPDFERLALQSLHYPTSRAIVNTLWRWLEAITQGEEFDFNHELNTLQRQFRNSVYGDPTIYSLLNTAYQLNIPSFFIWEEGLIQYGYGKYQTRGLSTIFASDSLLDSDLTTQKDDSKDFLVNLGFPVPKGKIVYTLEEALTVVQDIGYPVAIKPVAGHEGIGVTAQITDKDTLIMAWEEAQDPAVTNPIVIEESLTGSDFRLVCVGEEFVAVVERRPPFVIGNGYNTLAELIEQENNTEVRQDTPTSPLTKILVDESLLNYIKEQDLSLDRVIAAEKTVYLRKVANISAGGVSIDCTSQIHPDNKQLAEDIAQYLGLACLGIDVITPDISQSWQQGNFGIIEINASPGVFMHLKPAQGNSIDVPRYIFDFFFKPGKPSRIPIITFNRLNQEELSYLIKQILTIYPDYLIGGVCQDTVYLNERQRINQKPYNTNIQSLLRHPGLDLLIAAYPDEIFQAEGLFYQGSNAVILLDPTVTEAILADSLLTDGILIEKTGDHLVKKTQQATENFLVANQENYLNICCQAIREILTNMALFCGDK
jgi:cyanophycin synthetase